MSRELSTEDVRKVARLARLKLTDDEVEMFARQLGDVLGYVDQLSQVDTTGVQPLVHAVEVANVFRPDVQQESLPREAALSNAPGSDGKYFLVPSILEQS